MRYTITTLLCFTALVAILLKFSMEPRPPSLTAWGYENPPSGKPFMDECYAFHNFYGKTIDEAELMFADNALRYSEDLMWMPDNCVPFYLMAYCNYLLSDASECGPEGASCFLMVVENQDKVIVARGGDLVTRVSSVLNRLEANQFWYGVSTGTYPDFKDRVKRCRNLIAPAG